MCGISGFWEPSGVNRYESEAIIHRMTDSIGHRGPDANGVWLDESSGIVLGHRRLAVLDLSPSGAQPMLSASGRYVLVYNGEIYNHLDIRGALDKELSGSANFVNPAWEGHSDTETLLAGFDAWGIEATIRKSIGMFAFAVWDRQNRTLTLVRDRIGEKPLYYGWQGNTFLFGSELKALRPHPSFQGTINRNALTLLLRHNCIPAPYSIFHGIAKLPPGCLLTVSLEKRAPQVWTYWSASQVAEKGVSHPFVGSPTESVDMLEKLLKDAVSRQMVADVPLGAFLSGGIDSSTIVALMQSQSPHPVKTFTIGFNDEACNEAALAKAVAKYLGTEHTELYVTPEQAMAVIPKLPSLYDEPFSDSSQIPTFLVSQLARQHVTVSLSGDAGDELFCGYNRYLLTNRLWGILSLIPVPGRMLAAKGMLALSPASWNKIASPLQPYIPAAFRLADVGEKLHKSARALTSPGPQSLYRSMTSHWSEPANVVIAGAEPETLLTGNGPILSGLNLIQRMMAMDMMTYLPDDILVKVDRATMGVSLESRVPFLDHRIVEFAWQLPMEYKIRDGQSKWALRQVLYRHVPRELIDRPKMGFSIPLQDWLRNGLREWAESLLDEGRLKQEGFFNPVPIRQKWMEHLSGKRNWQYQLWDVLMFQTWLEKWHIA